MTTLVNQVEPQFDKRDQLQQVKQLLVANEVVYGVFDCRGIRTGFIGITNRRIIFQEPSYHGRGHAMVSIPFSKITTMAQGGLTVFITCGSVVYDFEFKNYERTLMVHNWIITPLL